MRWIFSVCLSLLLASCYGSARPASSSIQAVLGEYRYQPAEWRIPAGQEITLTLSNQGKQPHEWALLKDPPKEPFDASQENLVLFRVEVSPGQDLVVTFRAPRAPGEYSVISSLPGDLEKGLVGKVVVVQPGY